MAADRIWPESRETKPGFPERRKEFTMTKTIEITSKSQVEKINQLASEAPYEVWLSTDTVMLDARSLMGLFSLVGKKARVVASDNVNPKAFRRLVDKMA